MAKCKEAVVFEWEDVYDILDVVDKYDYKIKFLQISEDDGVDFEWMMNLEYDMYEFATDTVMIETGVIGWFMDIPVYMTDSLFCGNMRAFCI